MKSLIKFDFVQKEASLLEANMLVNKALPSFKGHFPENPVLPAVSIIDISLFLISHISRKVSYSKIEIKRSKFMAMVRPDQKVNITAHSEDGKTWQVLWLSCDDQSKLAQVQLVL